MSNIDKRDIRGISQLRQGLGLLGYSVRDLTDEEIWTALPTMMGVGRTIIGLRRFGEVVQETGKRKEAQP